MPPMQYSRHIKPGGDPEHAGVINPLALSIAFAILGNNSDLRLNTKILVAGGHSWGEGSPGHLAYKWWEMFG